MSQLRWQPVDAPQLSTRDIGAAGQTITNAFDRFGLILKDREAQLRKEQDDQLIAQGLAIRDTDQLAAYLQGIPGQAAGNRRVSARNVLEVLNPRFGQLQEEWVKSDDISNRKAVVDQADEIEALGRIKYGGNAEQIDAETRALYNSDFGRRALLASRDYLEGRFDTGTDDRMDNRKQSETERDNAARRAAEQQRIALEGQRVALAAQQAREAKAERAQEKADVRFARRFAGEFVGRADATANTDDTLRALIKTPTFGNMSPERQDKVLSILQDKVLGRDARLTPTEDQLGGIKPYTSSLAGVTDTISRVQQAQLNRFDAQNRPSAAIRKAAELGDVTPEQVYAVAAQRDISPEDVERVRAQNPGLGYNHLLATLQTDGSITDSDFWSRKNLLSNDTHWNFLTGGERALEKAARKVDDLLLNQGDMVRTDNERAKTSSHAQVLLDEASRLSSELKRVQALGGDTSVYAARIASLEKRAQKLQQTLTSK